MLLLKWVFISVNSHGLYCANGRLFGTRSIDRTIMYTVNVILRNQLINRPGSETTYDRIFRWSHSGCIIGRIWNELCPNTMRISMGGFIFKSIVELTIFHSGTRHVFFKVSLQIVLLNLDHFFSLLFTAFFNTSSRLESYWTRFQLCLRASWVVNTEIFSNWVEIADIGVGLDCWFLGILDHVRYVGHMRGWLILWVNGAILIKQRFKITVRIFIHALLVLDFEIVEF